MVITEQMRRALHAYILENCLTAKDLALKIDMAHVTPARWLSGKVTSMHPHAWKKLEPMLQPYLKMNKLVKITTIDLREENQEVIALREKNQELQKIISSQAHIIAVLTQK